MALYLRSTGLVLGFGSVDQRIDVVDRNEIDLNLKVTGKV